MILLQNKRAGFDYEILDTFEAGLVLEGWEVKSLRAKNGNLKGAWIKVREGAAWLENCKISRWLYSQEIQTKDRPRKLLLSKKELRKLWQKSQEQGMAVLVTKIYAKGKHIKCEVVIGKGRKKYEKRQVLKNRSMAKEARQALKKFKH